MFTRRLRSGIQRWLRHLIALTLIGLSASGYADGGGAVSETQTYCFGRFLIDLPKTAEINGQRYEYMFGAIETGRTPPKQNIHQDGFVEMMKTREAELRAIKQDRGVYTFTETRLSGEADSRIFVISRPPIYGGNKAYGFEAYRRNGGVLFSMKASTFGPDKIDSVLQRLETRLLPNLRARKPNEIPSEPGFCIEGGFIADDGKTPQYENAELSFRFKQWPDVRVSVYSRTNGDKVEEPLLTRRAKKPFPVEFAEAAKQVKVLRKGERNVNPHRGEEMLETYPSGEGYSVHKFVWDARGSSRSWSDPVLFVDFATGANPAPGSRMVRPSLTDKQAIELFDQIVNSIRLRPTTPGKTSDVSDPGSPSPANANRLPLKTKVTSAANCPQTGMWECAADTPSITEHRRFIEVGQPMPYGVVQRPAKGLGGFLGSKEDETVEITWTLVAYDNDAS